jgi:hypothetical protein
MRQLTSEATLAVQDLSRRYGVSVDAVSCLLTAVSAGGGTMAQFSHPELGGGGQWMQGGMTMVGDMFNTGLQNTVSGLCGELSSLLRSQDPFVPQPAPGGGGWSGSSSGAWWPSALGQPSSSGGQNDARYACFPETRRLAVERGGKITVYDTLDHSIGGVQQQQGVGHGDLSFTSQRGTFSVASLPVVSPPPAPPAANFLSGNTQPDAQAGAPPDARGELSSLPFLLSQPPASSQPASSQPAPSPQPPQAWTPPASVPPAQVSPGWSQPPPSHQSASQQSPQEILAVIERLGDLRQKGILSEDEFQAKKRELLARL